jgi:hypothetical protein
MTGNDLARALGGKAVGVAVVMIAISFFAGALSAHIWPTVKAFVHWATGDEQ